jgi:hypothetical protein
MNEQEWRRGVEAMMERWASLGLLKRTGDYRNGKPVYAKTAFFDRLSEQHPTNQAFEAAIDALVKQRQAGGH